MTEKIKFGYTCVVEDAVPHSERQQSAFIRRIPNPSSCFKNDGNKESMFAAADRHAKTSAEQIAKLK